MSDAAGADLPCRFLESPDGGMIAYRARAGKAPGVVFLTGFRSDMGGVKAAAVDAWCARRGQACLRFDYFGHGESQGDFAQGTVGRWLADTLLALDRLTEGPQILVGSSMGGWIMLLAALARPERVRALVGLAAAPDFTEDLIPGALDAAQRATLERTSRIDLPSPYDETPTPITQALLDDGRRHLVLRRTIPLHVPVRLRHGMADPDVPWATALRIAGQLAGRDVTVTLVKTGGHRLSEPADLDWIASTLDELGAS